MIISVVFILTFTGVVLFPTWVYWLALILDGMLKLSFFVTLINSNAERDREIKVLKDTVISIAGEVRRRN
jgi:hypothetical protein